MTYHYLAYGIPVVSEIELPALLPYEEAANSENPVYVKLGIVPTDLLSPGTHPDHFTYCNANEMIYTLPEKIKFYVINGNEIIVEPINPNYKINLLYFYSNCLAAILYQRDLIPFHVSGVFVEEGKVVLFAAPSRTGKSTLAIKLQELGYQPFTDDTAVLFVENGKCYAQASYPMIRLWQNSLAQQKLLQDSDKQQLYEDNDLDKYGFPFHERFAAKPAEVQQIIFLQQEEGSEIQTKPVKPLDAFVELSNNVYRCTWVPAMQKNKIQFGLISHILKITPYQLVTRPKGRSSFEDFPLFIKKNLQNKQ